jgi:predicted XRE-type DNA-binding protein
MDFFAQQENARQHTLRLVLLFIAAVASVIASVDLVATLGAALIFDKHDLPWLFHQVLDGAILIAIFMSALRRLFQLRGGGDSVAKMVSARQIMRHAENLDERRLLNVVDEMSIASGVAVPSVWVMDSEQGINAFAAGYSPNQAVIVVTHGMLTQLSRDELQGVIGLGKRTRDASFFLPGNSSSLRNDRTWGLDRTWVIEVQRSSGSVFADLGLPHADELKIKSGVVIEITRAVRKLGLTQQEAAKRMGITQPKVSDMMRGDFSNLSERKLMDCLNRLGYDIEIKVKPASKTVGHLMLAIA